MTEPAKPTITVRYSAVDGYSARKRFASLQEAQKFARKWVGDHPEIGSNYAISDDGVGKVTVSGTTLTELFPAMSDRNQQ